MLTTKQLYDLSHSLAGNYLAGFDYPWQALKGIKELILTLGPALGEDYTEVAPTVWIHKTATIAPSAYLGASSVPVRKSATAPLSAAAHWLATIAW